MVLQSEVRVAHTVDVLNESIDRLSDDSFFTYGWFKTLECFGRVPEPIYLTLSHEEETIGIAPCFIDKTDDFFSWGPNIFPFLHRALHVGQKLGLFKRDILLCYSPASCRTKVLLDNKYGDKAILEAFSKKIDDLCKERKILLSSFLFVSEFDKPLMNNLEDLNYSKFTNVLTFYLKIEWAQFDDYLKSLKPGMGKKIRREIRKCVENGVIINEESITQEIAEELSQLNANVSYKHSPTSSYKLDPSFFLTLKEYAKEKVRLFTARRNDKMIGFSLALQHKDTLDVYMYGSDYESQTNTFFTYFNLVYYKPIQIAIDEKIKKIYFRYFLAKSRLDRGCKTEQTYSFVKCHHTFFGPAVNSLLRSNFYRKIKIHYLRDSFPE
jgi:predicted N-acyltransferase